MTFLHAVQRQHRATTVQGGVDAKAVTWGAFTTAFDVQQAIRKHLVQPDPLNPVEEEQVEIPAVETPAEAPTPEPLVFVSRGSNKHKAVVTQSSVVTRSEYVESLRRPAIGGKEDDEAEWESRAKYAANPEQGPNPWRKRDLLQSLYWYTIDADGKDGHFLSAEDIGTKLREWNIIANTTASSEAGKLRWRIRVLLAAPVEGGDKAQEACERATAYFEEVLGVKFDLRSNTPEQYWFTPRFTDPARFTLIDNPGELLDPWSLPPVETRQAQTPKQERQPGVYDPLPDVVRDALSAIKLQPDGAGGCYPPWIEIGMGVNAWCGGDEIGFELFNQWSSGQPKYGGTNDCRKHWNSWNPDGAIGIGTVLRQAKLSGWEPDPVRAPASKPKAAPISTDQAAIEAVERLAKMSKIDYDRVRDDEAKKLKIRAGTLDDEVAKRRAEYAAVSATSKIATFPKVEPWPVAVNTAELLDELAQSVNRFMMLPDHADTAVATWVAFSYVFDAVNISPNLAIQSPVSGCGKSTLMEWLGEVVNRPLCASNISVSVAFRAIDQFQPTFLLDEAETFITRQNDELRGILNSGHKRSGAFVLRSVGDSAEGFTCEQYSTWCPKAFALIKDLPTTLQNRSIVIPLRKMLAAESVEKLEDAEAGHFDMLRRKLARFAADQFDTVKTLRGHPPGLHNRAADNWEVLCRIGTIAGGRWPARIEAAASALSGTNTEQPGIDTQLLIDIRDLPLGKWKPAPSGFLYLSSGELAAELCRDPTLPWARIAHGKELTANSATRRLKAFKIVPSAIRFGTEPGQVAHGYRRDWFEDAWRRYIPPTT